MRYDEWQEGATVSIRHVISWTHRGHQFGKISNLEVPYKSYELTLLCYFMNFSVSLGVKFLVAYDNFDRAIQNLIDCIKMIILV